MRGRLCIFCFLLCAFPANAAEEFAASFRLRGGYDSNPLLAPGGKGSALIAWEAGVAYGRDHGDWITGATGEASLTRYQKQEFEPVQSYRLRLRLVNKNRSDIAIDATTTLARASNYDMRSEFVNQRVHLQRADGDLLPFVAGDLRLASLNELNILLGDFLPQPMRYLRGTITPGIAYVKDKSEAGISIAFSKTKYDEALDVFGFRRDNDRLQTAAYAKYGGDDLALSGALSFLRIPSQDEFFTDVNAMLFDVSFAAKLESWNAEVSFARTAEDTTFPVSPVTINTALQAKISRDLNGKTTAGIFGRMLQRKYWDAPLFSRTRVAGIEVSHEVFEDVRIAGEFAFARSLLISGAEAEGVIATLALTKRFGEGGKKKEIGAGGAGIGTARRNASDRRFAFCRMRGGTWCFRQPSAARGD